MISKYSNTYQIPVTTIQTRFPTQARQALIVAAAIRQAAQRSPALITTSDIAAEVGVTQGALFKHFPTKDAIWLAAISWVSQELPARLEEAANSAASPLQALRAVFDAHIDFVVANGGVPRLIFHELQQPGDRAVKRQVQALLQGYQQLLLRLLGGSQLRQGLDHGAAAMLFVGIIQGLVMQSMVSGDSNAMKSKSGPVFTIYLQGICP